MKKRVDIELFKAHFGQLKILNEKRRFNCIVCARRFGKTELISNIKNSLITGAVFNGEYIAVFAPVFKDISQTWRVILDKYKELIKEKDNSKHIIYFHGGGVLYFWSLTNEGHKNDGRGYRFHRVIYEETQKIPDSVFEHHFKTVSRPALSDFKGDGFFIGTANGKTNHFYKLIQRGVVNGKCEINHFGEYDIDVIDDEIGDNQDWMTFRMITTDNPKIDPLEVIAAARDLDEQSYHQEYFSVFVNFEGQSWAYVFRDRQLQSKVFKKAMPMNWEERIFLAFDFNKVPMTAIFMQKHYLSQKQTIETNFKYAPHLKKEFKVGIKGNSATIYDTCKAIRVWVYEQTGKKIGIWYNEKDEVIGKYQCAFAFRVTGDASGNATSGMVKDPTNYYKIIKDELQLPDSAFDIPKSNPWHADCHLQLNTIYSRCPEIAVDLDNCKELIKDLLRIKDDGKHGIAKSAGEAHQADLLDCNRYLFNTFCQDIRK